MLKKTGYALGSLLGLAVAAVILTLAVLAGYEWFFRITGRRFTETQVGSAGAWASAIGATILALVSVGLAVQAGRHARAAEERAQAEADKTEQRHEKELTKAETRLDRQIKAEWYREQARSVAALWESVNRAMEPIARLEQAIDEHLALRRAIPPDSPDLQASIYVVGGAYVEWKFRLFDVQTALTTADMLNDDHEIRRQLDVLKAHINRHMRDAKRWKNDATDGDGIGGTLNLVQSINLMMVLQDPMTYEIRRLRASTTSPSG